MRDPSRLNSFYEELKNIHKEYFLDWRAGQLCSNFFGWLSEVKGVDPFFPRMPKRIYSTYNRRL